MPVRSRNLGMIAPCYLFVSGVIVLCRVNCRSPTHLNCAAIVPRIVPRKLVARLRWKVPRREGFFLSRSSRRPLVTLAHDQAGPDIVDWLGRPLALLMMCPGPSPQAARFRCGRHDGGAPMRCSIEIINACLWQLAGNRERLTDVRFRR